MSGLSSASRFAIFDETGKPVTVTLDELKVAVGVTALQGALETLLATMQASLAATAGPLSDAVAAAHQAAVAALSHVQNAGGFLSDQGATTIAATQQLDPNTGRVVSAIGVPPIVAMNLSYKFTGAIGYTAAAGSPATATISVGAGQLLIGSVPLSYNAMSASVTGDAGATVTFYLYVVEPDPTSLGSSKTLIATTNGDDVYASNDNVWIGTCPVTFPASGSATGAGGGGGGGGGYYGGGGGSAGIRPTNPYP